MPSKAVKLRFSGRKGVVALAVARVQALQANGVGRYQDMHLMCAACSIDDPAHPGAAGNGIGLKIQRNRHPRPQKRGDMRPDHLTQSP